MSLSSEQIQAQEAAWQSPSKWWHRHLIGPSELESVLADARRYRAVRTMNGVQFSKLCAENLETGTHFDKLVDDFKPIFAQP